MAHKLLLADDSVTIQRVIELTFADEDVEVVAVGDGKKAIASIEADRPDIVLADVGMPERDGYEVAAYIKGTPELAHIPVLLLTGAFEPIDETRARAVGCDGVLVKPFEPQMVISRVKDLLAGRRPTGLWTASPAAQTPIRQTVPQASEFDLKGPGPQATPGVPAGSLEDYFDRLDAAFESLGGPTVEAPPAARESPPPVTRPPIEVKPPAQQEAPAHHHAPAHHQAPAPVRDAMGDDLAGWDPDLTGDPTKPAPLEPRPIDLDPSRGYAPVTPPAPAPSHAPSPRAFTDAPAPAAAAHTAAMPSLAEAFAALLSAEQGQPVAPSAIPAVPVTDQMVEEIVRRVIARMSDEAVRETVLDVAERLVRQEIERIKGA
jgi:CheY-like chemotaxis protein